MIEPNAEENEDEYVKKKIQLRVSPVIYKQMLSVMEDMGIVNESVMAHVAIKAYLNTHYRGENKT